MERLHLTLAELEDGLDEIRRSPADNGVVRMIVRHAARIDAKCSRRSIGPGRGAGGRRLEQDRQLDDAGRLPAPGDADLAIMNVRCVALLAQSESALVRWLATSCYCDLDLSSDNLPPRGAPEGGGERRTRGDGCAAHRVQAVRQRYGTDATKFVNSPEGKRLHLRGVNARVIAPGMIKTGDVVQKL